MSETYQPTKPCKRGHLAPRYKSSRACTLCHVERWKERGSAYLARRHIKAGIVVPRPAPAACELCGNEPRGRLQRLCMDHDHVTGLFRGWLCQPCNSGIGALGDSVEAIERALQYLQRGKSVSAPLKVLLSRP